MKIGIVVPIYKEHFEPDEQISLQHLFCYLKDYDIFYLSPHQLNLKVPDGRFIRFGDKFFTSVHTYSKLLLSPSFYEAFQKYDYILIYQLDCLVFSDQLIQWVQAGYDYIGAPFYYSETDPSKGLSHVGNGGFSLRRIKACLDVLNSRHVPGLKEIFTTPLPDTANLPPGKRLVKRLRVIQSARRGIEWYTSHYSLNEDLFWSNRARLFDPRFRIAPVDEALRFSFERFPRKCFEINTKQIPFGCHAWAKWDREFWEPYLLQ